MDLFQSSPSIQRETVYRLAILMILIFQSSPSIQRETFIFTTVKGYSNISILSLYTEGDLVYGYNKPVTLISILSLYTEGDVFSVKLFTMV